MKMILVRSCGECPYSVPDIDGYFCSNKEDASDPVNPATIDPACPLPEAKEEEK